MKVSGTLLLASILALVAMAPPAYPQRPSERDMLNDLTIDVIALKNSLRLLQESADQKNAAVLSLVEQISSQFTTLNANVQKMNDSLTAVRTDNDKVSGEMRTLVGDLRTNVGEITENLTGVNNQLRAMSEQLVAMKATEQLLPGPADLWSQAYSDYLSGQHQVAILEFKDFLTQYPSDERAANAQIHIGKIYTAQKQYDQAVIALDEALQRYPQSDKTCTALYEKGLALAGLKKNADARVTLQQVTRDCPGTPEFTSATNALKTVPAR